MKKIIKKADILIEALPYIRKFKGKAFVIKYGGSLIDNKKAAEGILEDAVFLNMVGIKPVIVHGGGGEITAMMKRKGLKPVFVSGHRVTDGPTMKLVETALTKLNRNIMSKVRALGPRALGLTGRDHLIRTVKDTTHGDLGFVGKIVAVNNHLIDKLIDEGLIPVIAPIGIASDGKVYNINADVVAATIAGQINAHKLILLTDVSGVMLNLKKRHSLISTLTFKRAKALMDKNIISQGMIPKVSACMAALEKGVAKSHIIDGRVPHALLLEIFTDKGIGTEIIKNEK